jgi:di/tricarboxylate transporter
MVDEGSPWIGKPFGEFKAHYEGRLRVVDWLRHGTRLRRRRNERELQAKDVLLVLASPDEIVSIREERGLSLHAVVKYGDNAEGSERKADESLGEEELVQALVGPGSPFAGKTIGDIDFLRTQGVVVVGLWRKQGWIREEISQVRVQEGDMLVLSGRQPQFVELAAHHGVLMMVPFKGTKRQLHRWPIAAAIMVASVVIAATELLPAHIAFLAGALAMVLTRCVDLEQAYGAIEVRIFVMIAGVIPLGIAMEQTGTAQVFAGQLLRVVDDWSALYVLLVMFGAAALLTQILSDAATTALLAPVAIAVADSLGLSPVPFVVCTALGAVASFLTPIGHHGNLLILNPGQYTFGDFLRVGIPLTLLIAFASAWMSRWLWLGGSLLPGGL